MMVNPLHPLLTNIARFSQETAYAKQRESKMVQDVLTFMRLPDLARELRADAVSGQVTWEQFNNSANFPLRLQHTFDIGADGKQMHQSDKYVHPLWFKSFSSLPVVTRYLELYAELPKDKPFGLIFPRRGIGQGLILHNGSLELYVPPGSACHVYRGGTKHNLMLIVQPLLSLLTAVRDLQGIMTESENDNG